MLRLNTIKAQPGATHRKKRLGRGAGSGHGMTSGKGDKGQLARSGGVSRPGFEGGQMPLYRRLPKKGFKNSARRSIAIVNLADLERPDFAGLKEISLESLQGANLIKGRYDRLAILGTGELKKAFTFKAHRVSESAQAKIAKAGGKVEMIAIPGPQLNSLERKAERNKKTPKAKK